MRRYRYGMICDPVLRFLTVGSVKLFVFLLFLTVAWIVYLFAS